MGYDVSYHAISKDEMREWYFDALKWARASEFERIEKFAANCCVEEFYAQKYKDTLLAALQYGTDENFNKTHGLHIAVVQGFFRKYFYTRGTAFSFLAEQDPKIRDFISDWREVLPTEFLAEFSGQIHNEIIENYCCGAYLDAQNTARLKREYDAGGEIKEAIDIFYAQNLPAFLDALNFAVELKTGLLEATEVVEPNPLDLNKSESYSNLFNCDPKGALIYADTAAKQISEVMAQDKAAQGKSDDKDKGSDDKNHDASGEKKSFFDKIKELFK